MEKETPDSKNHSPRDGRLTSEKQELAELPLHENGDEPDTFPLSFSQERLWFLHQLEPNSAAYNIAGAMRLQGALNVAALEHAINEIVRRHESLRTTFSLVDGHPVQVVTPFGAVPLPVIDLGRTPAAERAAEVERLNTQEARRPFDLEKGPLVRATLLRLGDAEHVLLFTMHHIISDGWSLNVVVMEVGALYEAYTQGHASPLPELEIQYADFAVWQREWLRGKVLDQQLSYWKDKLGGSPPILQLPTDHPRPASGISRGEKVPMRISAALLRSLKQLSNREGVTLYMTLLAAFQTLLMRYSGQDDIVVGTPTAGRNRPEVEGLIGFFVNTLAMRTDLSGDPTFAELLSRVRETSLGAYAHQDVPFEKLVEELRPERHLGHSPLFQVMFILQNTPSKSARLSGLSLSALAVETGTAKFDLTLEMREEGGGLWGEMEYAAELFERESVERLAGAYVRLLEEAAGSPEGRLSELTSVRGEERRVLLDEWNDTRVDYSTEARIHEMFEEQAARTPDAVALIFGDVTLTYRELNERANRLAHHLRSLGVERESLVGVLLERTEQMVVSVLAVLKAGGAYVPLDPAYPRERLRFTLDDSRAGVLITQESLLAQESLADLLGAATLSVVRVDADSEQISSHPGTPPASGVTAGNLAYVIYTSGSTGRPKGVAIAHRSAVAFVSWALSVYDAGQLRGVLASTSLNFDLSVFELFAPLSCGGCVLVADSALSLAAVAARHEVTLVNTVPSAMTELLRAGDVPGGLEVVNLAGEPLTRALAESTYAAGVARVYNLYGPTEDTTYSTWELVNRGCEPTIGRPISNTRAYVLDAGMNLVPVGVAGELYLGGDGLARGYLNRPSLTAERFVPDPFARSAGGRLYRTGDVVRHLPDGRIEFMGRADQQVKVRGFRIELGEVEAALLSHERVRECIVVARELAGGDKRLVAYVVAEEGGEGVAAAELRAYLKGRLPEYMVPAAFVTLGAMPLTPNGKVDRKALPEPSSAQTRAGYVGARTPVEGGLAGVWSRLLGLEKVCVHDSFFELGGHSLLAMQLVSAVREAFGVDLPLRAVFESPTVAELATRVEREMGVGPAGSAAIARSPRGDTLPLSYAQERLWFLDRLEPGSPLYNISAAIRLRGALDVAALSKTFDEIIRRHESLRTTFPVVEGRPAQVVSNAAPLHLRLDDLSHMEGAAREERVRQLTAEEAARPFDLARGPLVRASLLRLAEEEHVLLWTMHHIVSDGWSLGVLVHEVAALYDALSSGAAPTLAELPIQYADFAVWQRGWLQGEVLEGHLAYWRKHLAGAPPVLQLPTDHPRPAVQTFRGARHAFKLSPELAARLRALSQREGATLYMTLLAAFQILLARYSGQEDIVVGTPIANRNRSEVEGLIGFFVNTLAMRTDLSGNPTFAELLGRVRETSLGAYAHQDVPFEKLVEELQPERNPGYSPLLQVMFILQNTPAKSARLSGLSLSALAVETGTAKFDLTLEMREEGGGLWGEMEYAAELFERESVERLAGAYVRLLEEAAGSPEGRLSELTSVRGEERRVLLDEWNDTRVDYSTEARIHEMFEEQAARTPDAVALIFGDERVTFAELNGRANRLAHFLRKAGVGPESRVGVAVERSVEMVVGLLGILKAGGAYVPLDPNYPRERIAFMLEDSQPSALLTQQHLADGLPVYHGTIVRLDADRERIDAESDENPPPSALPENLAYVIYTSGSTGRPKGVLGIHCACINRFEWMWERDPFGRDEICCQKTSLSFVDSIWEIFGPLLQGVPLVIIPDEVVKDPPRLVEVLAERAVTRIVLVPSLMRALLDAGAGTQLRRLRHWVSSGEALTPDLVERFKQGVDRRRGGMSRTRHLLNLYGSSEVCADATCYETPQQLEGRSVPIGQPIANTEVFILDRHMQLVPAGVVGEIYVGGEGLARGYMGRPDLTAERFVPHPFATAPGTRLYRTGDLGRHLPAGDIEYVGRADHQVKVRGVRIELGEIEAVLAEHPAVGACVVLLREGAREDEANAGARLVAYVVVADEASDLGAAELRVYARERLPEHMVPSHFVLLDRLPLTPNGKVDRRALPAPDLSGTAADGYVAPRTPVEELVAGVWAEVLGVGRVGVEDDFFDAGGHSLLATQLVTRLREAFGVEVPLRNFFGAPTVGGVAAFIERAFGEGVDGRQPQIERVSRDEPLPLSFAQERLWFLHQLEPDSPAYNILIPMRIRGRLNTGLMEQSFAEVVRRHEIYRTTYHLAEGRPVQVVHPPREFDWPVVDLTGLPEEEREREAGRLIVEEGSRPFDLERGPLWRVLLVRLGEEEHVLVLTEHHMVHDGWTEGTLVRDFLRFYAAHSAGEPPPLAELPIQYADFAAWQRRHFQGATLEQSLAYWKERLGDLPPVLELPTDRPRPATQTLRGRVTSFTLPDSLTKGLNEISRRRRVTLFMTLLAGFQALLHRYTSQTDIVVGTPIANRTHVEVEKLAGFFTNTLVLRTDLSGDPTFTELLARVRDVALAAYAHQDMPFEKLVEALQPARDVSHNPLFQVMFVFMNTPRVALEIPGLSIEAWPVHNETAKFDILLAMREVEGTLHGEIEYNSDLFDPSTVERLIRHFQTLLEVVVNEPSQNISSLPLLGGEERERLLVGWNDTRADYPRGECVHELFESRASETPDAVALAFEDERLTYAELNRRANKLAHYLRSRGVGPESRVGVAVVRSVEMVVGLLGVLKAGGAYVPLDPNYPRGRLAQILEDARVKLILTQSHLAERLPETDAEVVRLDGDAHKLDGEGEANPHSGATPDNLLYVIYTSGSTGRPKGIAMPHRPLVNLLTWVGRHHDLAAGARTLQFASLSFDVSFEDIFSTLLTGGTLVVVPDEVRNDILGLPRVLAEKEISRVILSPAALQQVAEVVARQESPPPSLRRVVVSGEQLQITEAITKLFDGLDDITLRNEYGPTETHVVTAFTLARPVSEWPSRPAIGRPIANAQIFILDKNAQPVPVGVPGELYIGGDALARGYMGRAALTAERFVPDPFSTEPGARLYRTGDLARWRAEGELEYLGRLDEQVKVRGFRVELGEIESVLAQHPPVHEVVVMARRDPPGDLRLVAYVASNNLSAQFAAELRNYARERLPDYMIPSHFVLLDRLPLTANGKVDRRALPAPDLSRAGVAQKYEAPRTAVEELVAGLWAEVLGIKRVGVEDNFFDAGGHSLLATQLVSRLRDSFGVEIALRRLFETPTVRGVAAAVEEGLKGGAGQQSPPITRASKDAPPPLSFAQQRLWFLHQLEPDTAVYNVPVAVRFAGELNVAALEWTLGEILRRHEALRTTFADMASGPVQVIADTLELPLSITDLRHFPEDEREREAQRLAEAEARRPFDLARGPLVRASLLRLADTDHVVLFTMHHIVSDGWSMGLLVREVTALYAAFVAGQQSPLAELPIQYADFAVWQREYLSGEVLEEQLSYWRKQLAGAPPVLDLPTDRPRPAVHTLRGEKQGFNFPFELLEGLRDLSRREGATLYMVLLAAFQTLLSRYSGQEDIVVGSPIANRNRAETESLIGFFVNTLAMRTDLSGDPKFTELLGRVRETSLGAYAHQDVPFEKLVEELQPERDMSHAPIFQVALTLQNVPMEDASFGGLTLTHVPVETGTSMFDFRIWLSEWDEGLGGHIEYNTDLFDAATMRRLVEHFGRLLSAAAEDSSRRLSELPLAGEEERRKVLVEWNDTATVYPRDAAVHELFERQVERTPDAVAVVFGDEQLTYAELNRRSNRLAHYLRGLGVGPEVCVGLCVERSFEMVVGLLGILKAGGAYLPIDAAYPLERITFMLEEAGVPVLLTQERLLDELPAHWAHVLCLDTEWEQVEGESEENPRAEVSAENLAYVIYTSGSTGQPKGVGVIQRNVVRLVKENYFASFAPEEVFLQLASVSFDASTFEVWGSLLNGARLVVAPAHALSLEELGRFVRERGVTTMWLTAGLFHQMTEGRLADLRGVRQLLAGGDVLSVPHVRRALRELPGCRLINGYGPTESTTFACTHALEDEGELAASVPIGRPIANTTVYLLDARMEPAPVGVWGELHIGGDGLARGYLKRPALTAERFIPDPFARSAGARLYRTGDVARYLEDGRIEFQGRRDQQVKVRGFRIELGEIEAVLTQHRAVREAVAVARQGQEPGGDKQLVAYLVCDPEGTAPNASELHRYARERLPDYMIPSHFVLLDRLPLTANGKVDRRALPAPEQTRPEQEAAFVAPRNELEETLARVWAEVLEVERAGVNDDFFDLGGHSLLATQVISRVRGLFGVELPLRCMFEAPTIAEMCATLAEEIAARESEPQAATIERVGRDATLPLSSAQQRLWFLDQFEPGLAVYNIPMAVRLRGQLNFAALERTLNEIVRRHEALRTTFAVEGGEPVQVIAESLALELPVVDLSELPDETRAAEVERLTGEEAREPFDLSTGPLLRMKLLRLADAEHVMLFTIHHIVGDNWSLNVFVGEVAALYEAFRNGEPSPLAELPIQYADYAAWQREYLSGEVLEGQLSYWREQLRDVPVLELPTDRPHSVAQTFKGTTEQFMLEPSLAESLHSLSRRENVTLYMTLLAAFQTLLSRYSGQDDIVVGSAIANRNRAETESLIGFFVNTLAMRTDLSGDPKFTETLARVREVALGAYAHQDVPFEKLVEELQTERDMSHAPLFQVAFALQNAPGGRLELPGLALEYVPTDSGAAHFDLTLLLTESGAGLWGYLEYNTDLFDAATMRRFVKHFENLLRGIAADPERRLSELPLVGEDERRQLLVGWNETTTDYPRDAAIHELFERQVERTPDAVAVVFGDERLTYAELNRRSNRLARHLMRAGVGVETRVGICVERSAEMVVGLLGILKSGGVYVPLDPTHPAPRLAFMLEDAAVPVLLTQERLAHALPAHDGLTVRLDADWDAIEKESPENPGATSAGDNLAYVIYTSGTTGQPKGSAIPHRAVNRLVVNTDYVRLDASDRVAQVSNSSFDAATFEIWGALLNGAALVIFAKDLALSPREFAAQLREQRVTTLFLTTALFNLLAAKAPEAFGGLRHLLFGGEAVDPGWVREVLANAPPRRLLHVYGPTESTTYATWHTVERVAPGATTVPIGRAVANTQIYVLDEAMRPVPVNVAGELYIGGDGLARNYHERPAQTAAHFVPNPYGATPGARLYRTGDVVRWREGGHIEFLGRRDHQVKVRGFRIELGEVEAVLTQHPSVREAVVVAQGERAEKQLIAYVVGQQVAAPPPGASVQMTAAAPARVSLVAELRGHVRERLPDYMVPSHFVLLDALPLTPNGKVDRRALPAPDVSRAEFEHDYVAPRTPVEELVAGVWTEVLGLERVGVEDNFFDAGGHSLLATQLVSRLRDSFGVEIALRRLFETPTVRGVAAAVEEGLKGGAGQQSPPIERVSRDEPLPLSFAQQRLWFFEQLEPGTNAYNVPIAVRLRGELDVNALWKTLNEITRRHEALRTTFSVFEGEPVQVIADTLELPLSVTDLRHLPEDEREAEAERVIAAEAREPFDLALGPLLRARLLRLAEEEHALLFTMHHVISDGWSMGVLVREVATLYAAYVSGLVSPLPELEIQYADFAVWQREYLSGEVLEEQLSYWRRQLAGAPPVLDLPTDRPRPAVRSLRGAVQSVQLPEGLTAGLKTLSQREGATLYMTLLAAFQTLLSRHSGQEDIVVGSPIAGRNRAETESLIGFFVNTLAMRTDLSGDPTFAELLGRVRETSLGAYAHQDVPFEKLVEELRPERDTSHAPIFQVVFALQNAPGGRLELPGLNLEYMPTDIGTIRFDLTLLMHEAEDGLAGVLRYNPDLFDAATISRMVTHWQELLRAVALDPRQRLSELTLLTEGERRQLLVEWNDTAREYDRQKCVHELFEEHAARTPDAPALVFGDVRLSYEELNTRANRLAHFLRKAGVGPETVVGICMENSPEMIVALLGVLKAGGAYVGPDPSLPPERLAFMFEDSHMRLILTQERLRERLPHNEAEVISVDAEWDAIGRESGENPATVVTPQNLAYVIYTSGSTGRPKGVVGEHRQLLHYLNGILERLEMKPDASFAMHQTLAVDAPITYLFASLSTGCVLHVLTQHLASDPDALGRYFREHRIDYFKVAPSHLAALQASSRPEQVLPRHLLMVGGEASHWDWAERVRELAPDCVVLNHYGPTETTVGVLTYRVEERPANYHSPVLPLGRPIGDTEIYILDRHLRPVPVGVAGELHVGGGGLARGYLDRPGVTAEKFIPDPFGPRPGARLYKTGDLARYLPDGNVEFLGRIDHQVKIRAFRVELGEIETALANHPSVQTAVVTAREVSPGDTRLAAYVVFKQGVERDAGELRDALRRALPDYMIPSVFVALDDLPRTPQGKVDRRRLPAPELPRAEARAEYVAPSTPEEIEVASILSELLKVEGVGRDDDFFELGGHSLLATQVVSRLRELFRIELPLRRIFETPTVGGLAAAIAECRAQPDAEDVPQIEVLPRGDKGLAELLAEMEELSEDEVRALLDDEIEVNEDRR